MPAGIKRSPTKYPDFEIVMLPLLQFAADGQEHSLREAIESLADSYKLPDDERKMLLPIGRPELQKFAGALQGQRARKGVFITTSAFSKGAEEFAGNIENKIVLIDGERLAQLMIDFNVGVSTIATYEVKRVDTDYFTGG